MIFLKIIFSKIHFDFYSRIWLILTFKPVFVTLVFMHFKQIKITLMNCYFQTVSFQIVHLDCYCKIYSYSFHFRYIALFKKK